MVDGGSDSATPAAASVQLRFVGFCGADDSVEPAQLKEISEKHGWVEWGVLFRDEKAGTPRYASAKWLAENIEEVEDWVSEKWTMKANDWTRPWHESSNALTDVAPPGVFLQAPARSSQNLRTGKSYFIETKVEVLWGKAYLAIVYPEGLDHIEPLVTRPNGTSAGGRRERPALCPV